MCPRSGIAHTMEDAHSELSPRVGLPCVIRPGFTMGGTGGGVAYNVEEFETICTSGLEASLDELRDPDRGVPRRAGRSSRWR